MDPIQIFVLLVFLVIVAYYMAHTGGTWPRFKRSASAKQPPFTMDLTSLARDKKLERVVGMEDAIERVLHVLARRQKNNPLLIGEPGVGKTAVVEGLAARIVAGAVPPSFIGKTILSLNLGDLLAGTKYRGELEERLRVFIRSLERRPRETILFIDEIHMLEQARGGEGALDIADILKPTLARGDLQVIGATTWSEYQDYIKPDAALERRFQPVLIEEPSRDTTVRILQGVKDTYEQFHNVCIPTETVEAAVDASVQFIRDRFLPDKALDVIDEACAKVSIEASRPHAASLGLLHAASAMTRAECGSQRSPVVMPSDVEEIARQWHTHRTRPKT